ncbi:hypothetical protein [Thalassobacillus sp. CUG 92003]|uniref:hypothetical protein n=1 Tax=Thalassobacillus sp. CUG 92003 TaxID=2736641 RepID=UPI0015E6D2D1|nr:hypothetical protein [Thalassobacillus sp. CUG 92003]
MKQKSRMTEIVEKIEHLENTIFDLSNQKNMTKSKAQEKRRERYDLTRKDFAKNRTEISNINQEESSLWSDVKSLQEVIDELESEKAQFIQESLQEAVQLRREQMNKSREYMEKKERDILKMKFDYLVELEQKIYQARSHVDRQLEDFNEFILQHGNAKSVGASEYKEKSGRYLLDTGYGRKDLPGYFVSGDDYMELFSRQQDFGFLLYKEFGEIEADQKTAQKRYREIKRKEK